MSTPLKYTGPNSTFQPKPAAEGETGKTRPLITGQVYDDLPADHSVIKTLIARGLLVPVKEPAKDLPAPKTPVTDSGSVASGGGRSSGKAKH